MAADAWAGRAVVRREDPRLVRGGGRFVADVEPPGTLHVAFARSTVAHARLRGVDPAAALAAEGVHAVLTAADLDAAGIPDLPVTWLQPDQKSVASPLLARDRVLWAGEPVAAVVADSRYLAEDAAELVALALEELPATVDPLDALEPGAPVLHEDWGDNVVVRVRSGLGDADAAIAGADVVVSARLRVQRHMAMPLETRGAVASHDEATGQLTLWIANQAPHRVRTHLAQLIGWPEHDLRVIVPDVGGSFGLKDHIYAEEALVALLATRLRGTVKWVEDRREHFLGSVHAREQVHDAELAARADGTVVALRDHVVADAGAYCANVGVGPSATTLAMLPGPYAFADLRADLTAVATNKVPTGAYRGFGQPEATFAMERMMDRLARRLGRDPADLRLQNFVAADAFPYQTASGVTYDSGDYAAALRLALDEAGYDEWRRRQPELRSEGRHVGIGLGCYIEMTGLAPSREMAFVGFQLGGYESVVVRLDPHGGVTLLTGMVSTGQSHATTLAQICAAELGLEVAGVTVVQGDTAVTPYAAAGSIGSRGAAVGGPAVMRAARAMADRIRATGAHMLGAGEVRLEGGSAVAADGRSVPLAAVAHALSIGHDLPDGTDPGLEVSEVYDPTGLAFSYGMHVAVVEVDVETGVVDILRYVVAHDCGTVINPAVVAGQVIGGTAQGIGGALLEHLVYGEDGTLLTTSLLDYPLPLARDVPHIELHHLETPSPNVPGGIKGTGEGGAIAPPAAIAGAVEDALEPFGVQVDATPLTPAAVHQLIHDARRHTA